MEVDIVFPHQHGSVQIKVEFVVISEDFGPHGFILGEEWLTMYGFDLIHNGGKYFSIGNIRRKKWMLNKLKSKVDYQAVAWTAKEKVGKQTKEPEQFKKAMEAAEFNPNLSAEKKQKVMDVFSRWPLAFAHGSNDLGCVKKYKMNVTLKVEPPFPAELKKRAYPASPRVRKDLEDHVATLLDMGVLQKVQGTDEESVITPVIVVYGHGKSRMCGDFRALNTYTSNDSYPMPRISESISVLKGATHITVMDVNKGFHQIEMEIKSRKLVRIVTHQGVYEYKRMPFGLKNAPAVFQRMMDSEFYDELREGWMRVYMDDIIIFSNSLTEHLTRLAQVLKKIGNMGITISPKKCKFAFQSLTALGQVVSGLLISIDQNKVAPIMQQQVPRNVKDIQSFLGFASYYRQYIENFAGISKPLYKLLSKDVEFEMTHERELAFENIWKALITAPVLGMPDFEKPFKLYVDASFDGLGAALHQ